MAIYPAEEPISRRRESTDHNEEQLIMLDILPIIFSDAPTAPAVIMVASTTSTPSSGPQGLSEPDDAINNDTINKGVFELCLTMPRRDGAIQLPITAFTIGARELDPEGTAAEMAARHDLNASVQSHYIDTDIDYGTAQVTILKSPANAELKRIQKGVVDQIYYIPSQGFVGDDKVILKVTGADLQGDCPIQYMLYYNIHVTEEGIASYEGAAEQINNKYCPNGWALPVDKSE